MSFKSSFFRVYAPRRLLVALGAATVQALIFTAGFPTTPTLELLGRTMVVALGALTAFGVLERWPRRLPRWLARWALQVAGVAVAIPLTTFGVYVAITAGTMDWFWQTESRVNGFMTISISGLMVGPWIAVAGIFRQRDDAARHQALAFELERSELERNALDSRLRLLQAQVEPHFLFNTLANVRELVDTRSPQASKVLGHLIEYLRAAVPRLHEPAVTLRHELQLVRAYLELMQMRMPDRLMFSVAADEAALPLRCPPTTLLTLVENAVRHGIDPGETGGRIDVRVRLQGTRCLLEVADTGVGLREHASGLGTGLSTLRERLQLVFGGDAQLRVTEQVPHGVRVELEFPAEPGKP